MHSYNKRKSGDAGPQQPEDKQNGKKEREWQLTKYDQIRAYIDIDLGVALRKKLKENKKTIASWITENAEKYLNEEYNKNN